MPIFFLDKSEYSFSSSKYFMKSVTDDTIKEISNLTYVIDYHSSNIIPKVITTDEKIYQFSIFSLLNYFFLQQRTSMDLNAAVETSAIDRQFEGNVLKPLARAVYEQFFYCQKDLIPKNIVNLEQMKKTFIRPHNNSIIDRIALRQALPFTNTLAVLPTGLATQ